MMKIVLSILLSTFVYNIYSQSNSKFEASCDSIILLDGSTQLLNIQETKKNKILYFLCCDDRTVPRELRLSDIDTIIYRTVKISEKTTTENMVRKGFVPQLIFTSSKKKSKLKKMNNGSKTVIWTSDSICYKGHFHILNEDSIHINSHTLALNDIYSISMPIKSAKIVGDVFGVFFTAVGVGLIAQSGSGSSEFLGFGAGAFVVATTFYLMNLIRRKYKTKEKWEVNVIYNPL